MPKIVDRELRRDEVVQATWRVIARVGIDNVSIREIAAEAGHSTGVIAHYFKNKDEVLTTALQLAWRREVDRIARATATLSGFGALEALVAEVLPVGGDRTLEMAVWMSFWGRAVGDEQLAAQQRRYYGEWRALIRTCLEEAVACGAARPGVVPSDEAVRIAALVDGIGIQAVLEPDRISPTRLVELVVGYIRSLRSQPVAPMPA
ncbi:MAG: TetR/AcrR family transcriptional regulator [Actinomycetota bacterium]|jgi:AcrR family transcriptional regulator|nr:TetR/AcrR family transcriptional regulator [Actinomycetota bacterium]